MKHAKSVQGGRGTKASTPAKTGATGVNLNRKPFESTRLKGEIYKPWLDADFASVISAVAGRPRAAAGRRRPGERWPGSGTCAGSATATGYARGPHPVRVATVTW